MTSYPQWWTLQSVCIMISFDQCRFLRDVSLDTLKGSVVLILSKSSDIRISPTQPSVCEDMILDISPHLDIRPHVLRHRMFYDGRCLRLSKHLKDVFKNKAPNKVVKKSSRCLNYFKHLDDVLDHLNHLEDVLRHPKDVFKTSFLLRGVSWCNTDTPISVLTSPLVLSL